MAEALYEPLDFVLVRAPLLPVEAYLGLGTAAGPAENGASVAPPTTVPGPTADPQIRRALAVASGALLDALERQERGALSRRDQARLQSSLLRYLIRMSTRPTPYGLFAAVALGGWGARTDLALSSTAAQMRTRPDMAWLLALVAQLEARPEVRGALCLVANPLARVQAGRIVLSERAPPQDEQGGPAVSVRATGVARRALALARAPIPYADLAARLLESTPGATVEKVESLLTELWRQTLLLTDLRPPLTSAAPARYVVERLAGIPAAHDARTPLAAVLDAAAAWDALPATEAPAAYTRLVAQARQVGDPGKGDSTPFQVDMALGLLGTHLTEAVAHEAVRAATLLLRLGPIPGGPPYLAAYRQQFLGRYGSARLVPVLELLDPEVGLGPPPWAAGSPGIPAAKANLRAQILRDLACRALYNHERTVELDAEILRRLETWSPTPATAPPSLEIYAFVGAPSVGALDAGDFQVIVGPNLGAMAAGRNLARFADLLGLEATAALARAARAEEARMPDRLWAEMVYLPRRLRSANVVIRPAVRGHEVVLGATPGVPAEQVIPLNELMVGVRDGRFYLHWPAGGIDVEVTTGHMLNTLNAPPACRFLCDLGRDGQVQLSGFDWGPAAGFPFLPRVQVGRIVLRPAHWNLDRAAVPSEPAADFPAALARWQRAWDVPRHVALSVGDNRLILDLADPAQAGELRNELRDLPEGRILVLQEVLPAFDQVWLPGPGGRYVCELVVSMALPPHGEVPAAPLPDAAGADRPVATAPPADAEAGPAGALPEHDDLADGAPTDSRGPASPAIVYPAALRLRAPGSDWLFAKLYCPRAVEDDLLADPVRNFAAEVVDAGLAEEWFFIRYADPDPHLRLRFRGEPERLERQLLPALSAWARDLMAAGHCLRFGFDTYDREIERYGGPAGTDVAEAVFAADSQAVVGLLRAVQERVLDLDRIALAALSVDDLLAGLDLDALTRLHWYEGQARAVWDEVGAEYRQRKTVLRALLAAPDGVQAHPDGAAVAHVLTTRRAALQPLAGRLAALAGAGRLTQPPSALYGSFVHLHCNRLLGGFGQEERQILGLLLRTLDGLTRTPAGRA